MHSTKGWRGGRAVAVLMTVTVAEPATTGAYERNHIDRRHRVGIPSHQGSLR